MEFPYEFSFGICQLAMKGMIDVRVYSKTAKDALGDLKRTGIV
jgi:hypothetical protein